MKQVARYEDSDRVAAVRVGDIVFSSGQMAVNDEMLVPEHIRPVPEWPWHGNHMERQLEYLYERLERALNDVGSSILSVAKINSFHLNPQELNTALSFRHRVFGLESPPPSTLLITPATTVPDATVILDIIALATDVERKVVTSKQRTTTPHAGIFGRPVYSQAIAGGGYIFTAGVSSIHKEGRAGEDSTTTINEDSPYRTNVFRNYAVGVLTELQLILEAAGASFKHVARAEIYVDDIHHLAVLDEVWSDFFPEHDVARVILPLPLRMGRPNKMLEIELIAVMPSSRLEKSVIRTADAPSPRGPEPQAVRAGELVFLSSQIATDYVNGIAPEARPDPNFPFHTAPIKQQVLFATRTMEAICTAAGTRLENVVRRRAGYVNIEDSVLGEEAWRSVVSSPHASTVIAVKPPLMVLDALVQFDVIVAAEE